MEYIDIFSVLWFVAGALSLALITAITTLIVTSSALFWAIRIMLSAEEHELKLLCRLDFLITRSRRAVLNSGAAMFAAALLAVAVASVLYSHHIDAWAWRQPWMERVFGRGPAEYIPGEATLFPDPIASIASRTMDMTFAFGMGAFSARMMRSPLWKVVASGLLGSLLIEPTYVCLLIGYACLASSSIRF